MRVAFVVQRYGLDIIGGAERLARLIAEELVRQRHWQVDVYTTTAQDYQRWNDHYDAGVEIINGVRVLRFRPWIARWPRFFSVINRVLTPLLKRGHEWPLLYFLLLGPLWQRLWLILQGPWCPMLVHELTANAPGYQRIFFFTYLYYPTVIGLPKTASKAVLFPTAHDEPPIYSPAMRRCLRLARKLLISTDVERQLLIRILGNDMHDYIRTGVGIDPPPLAPKRGHPPYILYLGRLGPSKNVPALLDDFMAFCSASERSIELHLAGQLEDGFEIPPHPRVRYLGVVEGDVKGDLLSRASCVVNPSEFESLSLLVIEGIACGVPVLVNKHCPVLASYCKQPSVFGYDDQASFIAQLQTILSTDWNQDPARSFLLVSRAWVLETFSWDSVLNIIETVTRDDAVELASTLVLAKDKT